MISRRIPQTGSRLLRSRTPRGSTTLGLFVVPHFLDSAFSCYSIASALRQGRLQSARTTLRGLRRKNKNWPTYSPTPLFHYTSKTIDRTLISRGARARRRESARKRGSLHNYDAVLEWSQRSCSWCLRASRGFWRERTPVVTHRYSVKGYPMTSSHICVWKRKEIGF